MTQMYKLTANNSTVCEVSMDVPVWLPFRPRLPQLWLLGLVRCALRNYLSRGPLYLEWNDSAANRQILN